MSLSRLSRRCVVLEAVSFTCDEEMLSSRPTKGTADAESCESECGELHFAGEMISLEIYVYKECVGFESS